MKILETVSQHRTVDLIEDVVADLHDEVRPDAKNVPVERRVMELAKRHAIRDVRLTQWVRVTQDVSSVQEFGVREPTYGTRLAIGAQHSRTERQLVDTLPHETSDIRTTSFINHGIG